MCIRDSHNSVLAAFADVRPAAEIDFQAAPPPVIMAEALTAADLAAIQSGLDEWGVYEQWLRTGEGHPFWPHTHPARISDTLPVSYTHLDVYKRQQLGSCCY